VSLWFAPNLILIRLSELSDAMKSFIYIFSICCLNFAECSTTNQPDCGELICTQEFRMVQVKFNDALGNAVAVKDFSSINKRTNRSMMQNNEPATINNLGNYIVASDADRTQLSETGDTILVSAIHPKTNKKMETQFVVSGGLCFCHINKLSGPAEITF
jgi:hypothetical protein